MGRCPQCGEWNTLEETAISAPVAATGLRAMTAGGLGRSGTGAASGTGSLPLTAVDPDEGTRISSGIGELDRVLGGGIMKKSAILVGGEPGIGKSTLLLQAAASCGTKGRVLYISGEESAGQIRMRADRLGISGERIELFCSARLDEVAHILEAVKPVIIIVDSVQTLHSPEIGPVPGTVNQMKYCAHELVSWVKERDAALFLVAHVTKDGIIAGPKSLEHLVDTVLYFEQNDADSRFLRAAKNRFGSVDEIGIFTMGDKGLTPVDDPSTLFLVRREGELPAGIATAAVLEGSRVLMVEIQALTVPSKGAMSRVFSDRVDNARVSRVAAVLEKHLGIRFSDHDLYVNVAGGIRIAEVGVELALAAALYSARTGLPLPSRLAVAGELSLAGELRPVRRLASRVKAARALGFERFVGPRNESIVRNDAGDRDGPETWTAAADLRSSIRIIFGDKKVKAATLDD